MNNQGPWIWDESVPMMLAGDRCRTTTLTGDNTMDMMANPAYAEVVRRYRVARDVWASNQNVRIAAATIGMEEREYCNRFINLYHNPITWTAAGTTPLPPLDFDQAFCEAAIAEPTP
jgi:hypothetical protein